MKLSKNAGWASEIIRKYYYAWKLRYTVKRIWAASVIAKYHAGWKVRKQYRVQLKKHAAPVIVRFFEAVNVSIPIELDTMYNPYEFYRCTCFLLN